MKGICFKEPLFYATVEGRKTQTRRLGKPRFKVGDVVYLKEPYSVVEPCSRFARDGVPVGTPIYKYNFPFNAIKWKNKLFMPASAARYFIRITAVRAERLQDISEEDCLKEGIQTISYDGMVDRSGYGILGEQYFYKELLSPQEAYATLIDKINGRGTWNSNPWVWVYDYELTKNIDRL